MNGDWGTTASTEKGIHEPSSLDNIDNQLEQLEKLISILRARLVHVLKENNETEMGQPTSAPRSPLAARAQRISESCLSVERLIDGLDI